MLVYVKISPVCGVINLLPRSNRWGKLQRAALATNAVLALVVGAVEWEGGETRALFGFPHFQKNHRDRPITGTFA